LSEIDGPAVSAALGVAGLRPTGSALLLATGWESSVWRCPTVAGEVAVRVYAPGLDPDRAAAEAVAMRLLERAAYPAPLVFHFEPDRHVLGSPFLVMDYLPGGTLRDSGRTPETVGAETARLMAELHRLDPERFGDRPEDPLSWLGEADRRVTEAFPGFEPVVAWIDERRGSIHARCTPAHLDFHPLNILLDADGEPWVIDWTSFRLTDPRLDVTWTELLGEMYGDEPFTSAFRAVYAEEMGTPEDLDFFRVVTAVRRLTDILFFLTPEGSAVVQDVGAVLEDAHRLTVAQAWILDATGVAVPEVEALLDSLVDEG
jgi:aminoglycoside phosphotransferase (APT) family kinase protein